MAKAWQDDAFKAQLLRDPKGALKAAFGVELPEGSPCTVVEDAAAATEFTLVLPPKPREPDGGLIELIKAQTYADQAAVCVC